LPVGSTFKKTLIVQNFLTIVHWIALTLLYHPHILPSRISILKKSCCGCPISKILHVFQKSLQPPKYQFR
jgi:hypothetical protein